MLRCAALVALLATAASARAANISNTWLLPEEGFPVFYRYFRERVSWYEADAVCQFHHANLITVDTTAQYDALRAYLKELDIASGVWLGLFRSTSGAEFTWTDYRRLSGEGWWRGAPHAAATPHTPLCAAAEPAANYRWSARVCSGPDFASFICELPVPSWAGGAAGCMVRALPAVTVVYVPELATVQLTADCGLAGVKNVSCTGNTKYEHILRELSCGEAEERTAHATSAGAVSRALRGADTSLRPQPTEAGYEQNSYGPTRRVPTDIGSNLHSNEIPNIVYEDDLRSNLPSDDVDEELHAQSKMLHDQVARHGNLETILTQPTDRVTRPLHEQSKVFHDEVARHGNLDTIFTQPTDRFVPPLVMAKARIGDDMRALSPDEKRAQRVAERRASASPTPPPDAASAPSAPSALGSHGSSSTAIASTETDLEYSPLNNYKWIFTKTPKSIMPKKYDARKYELKKSDPRLEYSQKVMDIYIPDARGKSGNYKLEITTKRSVDTTAATSAAAGRTHGDNPTTTLVLSMEDARRFKESYISNIPTLNKTESSTRTGTGSANSATTSLGVSIQPGHPSASAARAAYAASVAYAKPQPTPTTTAFATMSVITTIFVNSAYNKEVRPNVAPTVTAIAGVDAFEDGVSSSRLEPLEPAEPVEPGVQVRRPTSPQTGAGEEPPPPRPARSRRPHEHPRRKFNPFRILG